MSSSPADLVREANDVLINRRKADRVEEFFAPDYVVHATGGQMRGPAQVRGFVDAYLEAFPDIEVEVEIFATEGDTVAWRRRVRGTHETEFMGLPASRKKLTWYDLIVTRTVDGKIAEEWAESGLLGAALRG